MLENNDSMRVHSASEKADESGNNLLIDVINYLSGPRLELSKRTDVVMAGLVPSLPMYGDAEFDNPRPSVPYESAEKKPAEQYEEPEHKHKYEPPKIYGDPGIIARPDEWFKIENFTNPFNPIFH